MTLSSHVNYLRRSMNFQLRNLWRIRQFIDQDSYHHTVRALITSRVYYCNGLFTTLFAKELTRLQRLQNNAARLIFAVGRRTEATNLLDTLHTGFQFAKHYYLRYFCLLNTGVQITSRTSSPFMFLLSPCARLLTVTVFSFPDSATLSLVTKDSTLQQLRHGIHFLWT